MFVQVSHFWWVRCRAVIEDGGSGDRDLSALVVPAVGRLIATGDRYEPYRMLGPGGRVWPRVPSRVPRSIHDEEFNEIFTRLPSHRDRALVAFYVSTGARASELLSVTVGGVDPGRQLITVVRKGTGELQQLPASSDAFVWLRLYQVEMEGPDPDRPAAAAVVDPSSPGPAADLSRRAPDV